MKKILRPVIILVVVYISIGILFYLLQDVILFHAKSLIKEHQFSFDQPFEEINIDRGDRNLNVVKFKTDFNRKGIVLYFHGNRQNIERYSRFTPVFTSKGYEVWMPDYPGFGKSTGKRTEQAMYSDASFLYAMALKEVPAENIIIYGKSVGTGVASFLASNEESKALVLETPYYSIEKLVQYYMPIYPVDLLLKYKFPVHEYLKNVDEPVFMFHGTKDEVIPYKQAIQLKQENQKVKLILIENGKHNNLPNFKLFINTLDSLLNKLPGYLKNP
ncbi:MAG: alpha/beta hydrolase [Chitinophagaceae bacterium]